MNCRLLLIMLGVAYKPELWLLEITQCSRNLVHTKLKPHSQLFPTSHTHNATHSYKTLSNQNKKENQFKLRNVNNS